MAGCSVGRVGFGAMQLAELREQKAPDRDTAVAVLRRAVELGADHIDTADFYGDGVANELIRAALHPYPDDLVLVSKVGAEHDDEKGLVSAQRPEQLRAGVESNLRRLGVERLAVVNLRRLDSGVSVEATGDQRVDMDDQLAELVALRDEGKIDGVGLSNVGLEQLRHALPAGIVCVQNLYNLLDRSGEALLDECGKHDIAWVPFFPLGSAFAGIPKVTDEPAVIAAATALGATPAQIGLAWLLAHDPNVLLIPGTANVDHLAENMAAADIQLDAETMSTLDALASPSA
ncbi:MAG TPA: aldo/keto reductase [Mycobacteriales bacterium]|nr:aldo/keto reductase [Mycobacteriales bacterium]